MAKTTPEQKQVIDAFDALITFSYAYEWQKSKNDEIDKLIELGDEVSSFIKENDPLFFMTSKEEYKSDIIKTLNGLQATEGHECPKELELTDFWINKPEIFSLPYLIDKHDEKFEYIIDLVIFTIINLHCSLHAELKPFATIDQVGVILDKTLPQMESDFSVPIFKELLVNLIHQYFLKSKNISQDSQGKSYNFDPTNQVSYIELCNNNKNIEIIKNLVKDYCKKAEVKLIENIKDKTINRYVIKFFQKAKKINLEIGQLYSWSRIYYAPLNSNNLLSWYSTINAVNLITDAKYIGPHTSPSTINKDLELEKIIYNGLNYRSFTTNDLNKCYLFDTSRTTVEIEGKTPQNHLLIILPYDKPIPNLKDKLDCYENYLNREFDSYKQNNNSIFDTKEKESSSTSNIKTPSYKKRVLVNTGSILQHIISLVFIQLNHSAPKKSKKCMTLEVLEMMESHYFKYTQTTLETLRKKRNKEMNSAVKKSLEDLI